MEVKDGKLAVLDTKKSTFLISFQVIIVLLFQLKCPKHPFLHNVVLDQVGKLVHLLISNSRMYFEMGVNGNVISSSNSGTASSRAAAINNLYSVRIDTGTSQSYCSWNDPCSLVFNSIQSEPKLTVLK